MYDIYKSRKWAGLVPVVLFLGAVPVLLYVFIKDFIDNGFSITIIMGVLCTLMVAFFGYMFLVMFRADPYENIKKLKMSDPALVEQMENDFQYSKMVCQHIWKGQRFYFFEGGMKFMVVPIGEVKSFSIKDGYSRSIGPHYDCYVISDYGEADFAVAKIIKGADDVLDVAKEIAEESGFEFVY